MRVPFSQLTTEQIKQAGSIYGDCPSDPSCSGQIFGQEAMAAMPVGPPPHVTKTLEVVLDSSADFQELLRQVEAVKGHLPQDVQGLKK